MLQKKHRLAVSEVMGAVILIGVTLAIGFAAWAWARSAAANSELNLGNAVGSNISYLNENFEIVYVNYSSTKLSNATIWVYDNGNTNVYIKQMWISNSTGSFSQTFTTLNSTQNTQFKCNCLVLHPQQVVPITLTISPATFKAGIVYQFKALGVYGNTNTFQQTR
jgi:hypothetical protein